MSDFDIKSYILNKIKLCISKLPKDIYVLHCLIHVNDEEKEVPTLSLCFNTLANLSNGKIDSSEECWNLACWDAEEIPVIGNNFKITEEATETTKTLKEWFVANNCDYFNIEKDPLDDYYEYTVGHRVLSEIIQSITPDIKRMLKKMNGFDVICLVGDFSFVPSDVERIISMNGKDLEPFIQYYGDCSFSAECLHVENKNIIPEFIQGAIETLEKLKIDYNLEKEKSDELDKAIESFKELL